MVEINPFLAIAPKKEHKLIGLDKKKVRDFAKQLAKGGSIVVISGSHGSGKSAVSLKIEKELPKMIKKIKLVCSPSLAEELKGLKAKRRNVVFIEKFSMCLALGESTLRNILDMVGSMLDKGVSFVVTSTPELTATMPFLSDKLKHMLVFDIPSMSLEDAKQFIASRLGGGLGPFTENEILQIWKTSNGNPKMMLLLCASLYEAKSG